MSRKTEIRNSQLSAKLIARINTGEIKRYRYVENSDWTCCVLKKRGVRARIYKRSFGSRDVYELIVSDLRGRVFVRYTESQNDGEYSLKKLYECAHDLTLKKEEKIKRLVG